MRSQFRLLATVVAACSVAGAAVTGRAAFADALGAPVPPSGESQPGPQPHGFAGHAERAAVSPPLWSLVSPPAYTGAGENSPVRKIEEHRLPKVPKQKLGKGKTDTAVQSAPSLAAAMPAPLFTFEGLSNADNLAQYGYRVLPPDTNGDVGPHHYVQTVNLLFQAYDKVTGAPLLPHPAKISSLFAGFGGACENTDSGDPVLLYDSLADRWLISQLSTSGPPYHECVALSQTGDPTGRYFLYDFVLPNSKFNDYPKFGVWPDAYYMTDNQFTSLTGSFSGAGVYAFNRAKMLAGDPSPGFIYFDLNTLDPTIGSLLPADVDGPPPPAGTPNYISYFTATEFGDPQDGLRIFAFHPDFTTPDQSTFTELPESPIATAAFDPVLNCGSSGEDCIPQPSPANSNAKLDALADRLMHRLQYRNFGDHESLVVTHTVDVGNNHAGIRYYEVRRPLPGGSFAINEQASFAPDADHRWMGSAAMDGQGNLAVGYSVSSGSTFPSIRYAGRLATDPPGGLFQGEVALQAGAGSQTSSSSRWGDYSMLAVDPVDECTFWYTTEYYAASSTVGWQTRIGTFKFPGCGPTGPTPTTTATPTASLVPTATVSPTVTATVPPSSTPTNTPTGAPTSSPTSTPTHTATVLPTSTPTNTATSAPTSSPTSTPTRTPTAIAPTATPPAPMSLGAAQDAWIQQDSPTQNKGTDTSLHVKSLSGKLRRTLVQFDLSPVPAGTCVSSATLQLTLTKTQNKPRTYAAHALTASWTQGTGARNSGATWILRDGVTAWATAGGDFAPAASATASTGTTNGATVQWDVTADVAAMLAGSETNNGWVVKDANEGANAEFVFASRENSSVPKRPQLVLTFTACP